MKLRTLPVGVVATVLACAAPAQNTLPAGQSAAQNAAPAASAPSRSSCDPDYEVCDAPAAPAAAPTAAAAPAPRTPGAAAATAPPAGPAAKGPVHERAQVLRDAAEQLDRAQAALDAGNRYVAERLFSTAEFLVGAELLAPLADKFREGAPPRVTTPTRKVDRSTPAQPRVSGSSEAEDEADRIPPPRSGASLTGTMQIDGRPVVGTFGLVTLEPTEGNWKPRTPKHVVLEQRNREFRPHVMAVSVGTTVAFPNFDPVFHNVFTTSPTSPFDLGIYKAGEAREYTFPKEGIVRLACNLHANMSAYIAVVSAPAYVVTDDVGHFAFRRLAPGKYKLKAWSERSKAPITQDVVIKPGKNDITVGVAGDVAPGPQLDKFGGKRG